MTHSNHPNCIALHAGKQGARYAVVEALVDESKVIKYWPVKQYKNLLSLVCSIVYRFIYCVFCFIKNIRNY